MSQFLVDQELLKKFSTHSIVVGILLMITGLLGIFLPVAMSLTVTIFVAWLFIISGIFSAVQVYKNYKKKWMAWLKPFLLLVTGIFMLLYPLSGVAALGLLLAVYFFMDTFASVSLALELHPHRGWGWMLFNGLISLLLAILFLIYWPFGSLWLVGLFVGISLFMDGASLLGIGLAARKAERKE